MSEEIGFVGSKGELYPPKKIKELLHLKPKTRVKYKVSPKGYLIVEIIHSLGDLLRKPSIARISINDTESLSEGMQERGMKDAD
nr:hypothetical protein [Candidatus Sigynarchaeota archaeon]